MLGFTWAVTAPSRSRGNIPWRAVNGRVRTWRTTRLGSRSVVMASADDGQTGAEDGVTLPPLEAGKEEEEKAWLAKELADWLDKEWLPQEVHQSIGKRAAQVYLRARLEGEDLGGIVIEVGTELASFDFGDAFVGAFDVANKVSELILISMGREVCCAEASEEEKRQFNTDHPISEIPDSSASAAHDQNKVPTFPSFASGFDKYQFLQQAVDGRASADSVNAALAMVLGYELDQTTMEWSSDGVRDSFFVENFPESPPVVVGHQIDQNAVDYMKDVLSREKADLLTGLDDLIETLYGEEMTRISREAEDDDFLARELATKWLHYFGGKVGIF